MKLISLTIVLVVIGSLAIAGAYAGAGPADDKDADYDCWTCTIDAGLETCCPPQYSGSADRCIVTPVP